MKLYKVGLLIAAESWNLQGLVEKTREVEPYSSDDYYQRYLEPIAREISSPIQAFVSGYDESFHVSAGIKRSGQISAWVHVRLRITAYDAVVHCANYLTEYPRNFLRELAIVVNEIVGLRPDIMNRIYEDLDFRLKFFREAEQELRRRHNVPLIGEGNVSEMSLYRLVRQHYPDARHEYSPPWLLKQRFDIYIPSLQLAIEYNGEQHYEAHKLFGGEEGLKETRERDERKRNVAMMNGVTLYEWPYTTPITEEEVRQLFTSLCLAVVREGAGFSENDRRGGSVQ